MFYQIAKNGLSKLTSGLIQRLSSVGIATTSTNLPVYCDGIYLPSVRSNESLSENTEYLSSALELVNELKKAKEIVDGLKVLDFGCGQGRLANGLILSGTQRIEYVGIDTHKDSIEWCKKWIRASESNFSFIHLPAINARYNPEGGNLKPMPKIIKGIDCVFLNSVFSHMLADDITFYLEQFKKILKPDGAVYVTAFIDEGVAPVTENPENYYGRKSKGALHRVVYEKTYFFGLFEKCGFTVTSFEYQSISRTLQSAVIARVR